MGKWIDVKVRLPKKSGRYLTAELRGGEKRISARDFETETYGVESGSWSYGFYYDDDDRVTVTHWMRPPELPK